MAKEKNKTKLQGYMLSPYYGTEPPPETNIRCSRPPKSLGKTDVQSTNQDRDIISQIIKSGKGLLLVVNKWDLIKKDTGSLNTFHQDILDFYPALAHYPILFISVLHNLRVRSILKEALNVFNERGRKIKTTDLNTFVKKNVILV